MMERRFYLYLSTMATDHINHFDIRAFFYGFINLKSENATYKTLLPIASIKKIIIKT